MSMSHMSHVTYESCHMYEVYKARFKGEDTFVAIKVRMSHITHESRRI